MKESADRLFDMKFWIDIDVFVHSTLNTRNNTSIFLINIGPPWLRNKNSIACSNTLVLYIMTLIIIPRSHMPSMNLHLLRSRSGPNYTACRSLRPWCLMTFRLSSRDTLQMNWRPFSVPISLTFGAMIAIIHLTDDLWVGYISSLNPRSHRPNRRRCDRFISNIP